MLNMGAYTSALMAALAWGISPIFEKRGLGHASLPVGLLLRCWGTFLGSFFLIAFLPRGELRAIGWTPVLSFISAGILASVIGQVFAYNAIQRSDVSRVAPVMGSWPLVVVIFGWLILKEPLTFKKALGSGLIVAGVWLLRP